MQTEDRQIIHECLNSDPAEFGLLVDKYKASIYALAYSKLRNFHDAQDVTQETFIKAYSKLHTLRHWDNFVMWLGAIANNLCKQLIRSRSRQPDRESVEDYSPEIIDNISIKSYHDNMIQQSLNEALDSLPETYCQVMALHYISGMKSMEIARMLGVSLRTVTERLKIGRERLREEMVAMMKETYETQRLPVTFTFRIVEMIKRIRIHSKPNVPWLSWGATLTASIIFTILSLGSPHVTFDPYTDISDRYGNLGLSESGFLPISSVDKIGLLASAEKTNINEQSGGSKEVKSGSSEQDQTNQTNNTDQTNANTSGKIEMQTVSGKVLRDDNPVPNAKVYISLYNTKLKYEGITQADGTFKIEVAKPNDSAKWELTAIVAQLPGYSFNWAVVSKNDTSNIIIKLPKPATVEGIVSDDSGKPIHNAEVKVRIVSFKTSGTSIGVSNWISGDSVPNSIVKTEPTGKFIFRNLPEGSSVSIGISGQGYAKESKEGISTGIKGVIIKLKPEGRIEGKVTYSDTGQPAKKIGLYITGIYPTYGYADGTTDNNGYYTVTNLKAGEYDVLLQHGNKEWTAIARENIKVAEGQTTKGIDLKLIKGGIITGRVIDKDKNEPIYGQWIAMYDKAYPGPQGSVQSTNTDKDGNYQLRGAPGKARVYTSVAQGYEAVGPMERIIDVVEGGTIRDVNFEFQKFATATIKGSIFTSDGEPVAGAVITGLNERFKQYAVSDKDGKFTISGLRQGQKLAIKADQNELHLIGTAEIEINSDEEIEIVMDSYETISVNGRVINKKGESIQSADMGIIKWEGSSGIGTSAGIADSLGNYKIDNLVVGGEYYVSANAEGYREVSTEKFTVAKDMKTLPDIVLETAGKYFIDGTVKDMSGKPIVGATVMANRSSVSSQSRTDENGYYKLENLVNIVELEVAINHPDYGFSWFRYIPTNEKHDFVLEMADKYLSGKVVDTDGNPVTEANVYIEAKIPQDQNPSGHRNLGATTDSNGNFRLDHQLVNKKADISVSSLKDNYYKIFKDTEMNRDNVVLTYTKEGYAGPPKEPSPEDIEKDNQKRQYSKNTDKQAKEIIGKPSPEIDVGQWIIGKPVDISKLKGKIIVLHFWSYFWEVDNENMEDKGTLETIRFLNALQKAFSDKDVVFVSIHGYTQRIEELKKLVKEWNPAYNIAVDKKSPLKWSKGATLDKFGIFWGQTYVLIDRKGIVKTHTNWYDLENKIQELISNKSQ